MMMIDLRHGVTADDLLMTGGIEQNEAATTSKSLDSLRHAFDEDGFVIFPRAISLTVVQTLQQRLEDVLRGRYDRGTPPDKAPSLIVDSTKGGRRKLHPLGFDGTCGNLRVLQIINVHKCDNEFYKLATQQEIGETVAKLAGWEHGARLAQDQVWAKPPGSPPLVFHRDSPYFMFTPDDVVTVWIALDDMAEELGPLEYVRHSHLWGDGRVGSSSSFFQSDCRALLYSAATRQGIKDPENSLEIISLTGLHAGGLSIHHGKTWHGSQKNGSADRPRRGIGLHFVPAEVSFKKEDARKSKLWRKYVPDDTDDNSITINVRDIDFPLVWTPKMRRQKS
jgi:ectoine hydroxylase-related dioxygenase (phytanoyl-CoA dioxygenase family)